MLKLNYNKKHAVLVMNINYSPINKQIEPEELSSSSSSHVEDKPSLDTPVSNDSSLETHTFVHEAAPTITLTRTTFSETALAQVQALCEKYHQPDQSQHLLSLTEQSIDLETLTSHLDDIEGEEEKQVMFNTYLAIAHKIIDNGRQTEVYQKRIVNGKNRISHAFAISPEEIYIIPKQPKLMKGTVKVVTVAFPLIHPDEEFVRLKMKELDQVENEYNFIKMIHTKAQAEHIEGSECLVPPHTFRALSMTKNQEGRFILFQKRFQGDGDTLKQASIRQQICAFRDIARALSVLHKLNYAHMDVKPKNILIQGNILKGEDIKAKLCDFGVTSKIGDENKGYSIGYVSPERQDENNKVNPSWDQFALGVSIFETLLGRLPKVTLGLQDQGSLNACFKQLEGFISKKTNTTVHEKELQKSLLNVAKQLTKIDPNERITCEQAAQELSELIT